jgi:hypothetical protein
MSRESVCLKSGLIAASRIRATSNLTLKNDFNAIISVDEQFYDKRTYFDGSETYYPWMFSKTLAHDPITGFALKSDIDLVIDAVFDDSNDTLNSIRQHPNCINPLDGVPCGQSFNLMGTDTSVFVINPPLITSKESAFDMMMSYGMSVLRDTPFTQPTPVKKAVIDMLNLPEWDSHRTCVLDNHTNTITERSLFRGNNFGDLHGPYVSQFLYLPFKYGNLNINQQYVYEDDQRDSSTLDKWHELQNGLIKPTINDTWERKYIYTPRGLGGAVHNDAMYQLYLNAALVLNTTHEKPQISLTGKSTSWTSGGLPDILASVGHVALGALRTVFRNKWNVSMRIRPEVLAHRIHHGLLVDVDLPDKIHGYRDLLNNIAPGIPFLNKYIKPINHTYLLTLQYPEGSPSHPSCPAGHGTVGGACVTVLKAMVNCHDADNNKLPWINASRLTVKHSIDGNNLINYKEDDVASMTIIGELNKLVSNATIGRNWAGVHSQTDVNESIILGEKYAITYLIDKAKEYGESYTGVFTGFLLEKFDGTLVRIDSVGASPV